MDPHGKVIHYEGLWDHGEMCGQGTQTGPGENEVYIGKWEHDARHGHGKQVFANGQVYEGEFSGNDRHGQGILSNTKGTVLYTGLWKNDVQAPSWLLRQLRDHDIKDEKVATAAQLAVTHGAALGHPGGLVNMHEEKKLFLQQAQDKESLIIQGFHMAFVNFFCCKVATQNVSGFVFGTTHTDVCRPPHASPRTTRAFVRYHMHPTTHPAQTPSLL